jgi:hypothetical protein
VEEEIDDDHQASHGVGRCLALGQKSHDTDWQETGCAYEEDTKQIYGSTTHVAERNPRTENTGVMR